MTILLLIMLGLNTILLVGALGAVFKLQEDLVRLADLLVLMVLGPGE